MFVTLWHDDDLMRVKSFKWTSLCVYVIFTCLMMPVRSIPRRGNDPWTVILCKFKDIPYEPRSAEWFRSWLTDEVNDGSISSDQPIKIFPHSLEGEYDDKLDLMSTANAFMYPSLYGLNGPGLNGPHLDYLGWLPAYRMYYFGKNGAQDELLRLASLSVPHYHTEDILLVMIPYDKNNPQNVYTVEFRTPTSNDKGIGRSGVVIHKVRRSEDGYYFSYVITHGPSYYDLLQGTEWIEFLEKGVSHSAPGKPEYIRVWVENVDKFRSTADVRITSTFSPLACSSEETPRLATVNDTVCVSYVARAQVEHDNNRRLQNEDRYGRCYSGFYQRSSNPSDTVCVSREEYLRIQEQNSDWSKRERFYTSQTSWGLNACVSGYVWRQIDAYDYVCVTPERRNEILNENLEGRKLWDHANQQCAFGFDKRNSFLGDEVCVSTEQKATAKLETVLFQKQRLKYYGFFNGVDTVGD